MATVETSREELLNRQAGALGLRLERSPRWGGTPTFDDHGGYRLCDARLNTVVAGARFDLNLDRVEEWLNA